MSVEVYFSRPGQVSEIKDRIINDIKHAKKRLLIAQYEFSDEDIRKEVNNNQNVLDKRMILDKRDQILNGIDCVVLGGDGKPIYTHMHHKFLIIDDAVWVGSFNFSKTASSKNWENIIKINDSTVFNEYINEFKKMFVYGKCISFSKNEVSNVTYDDIFNNYKYECTCCNSQVEDIFAHFQPVHNVWFTEYQRVSEIEFEDEYGTHSFEDESVMLGKTLMQYRPDKLNYLKCISKVETIKVPCAKCQQLYKKHKLCELNILKRIECKVYKGDAEVTTKINDFETTYYFCEKCMDDYLRDNLA